MTPLARSVLRLDYLDLDAYPTVHRRGRYETTVVLTSTSTTTGSQRGLLYWLAGSIVEKGLLPA